jgi:hypothetical protein
MKAREQWHWDRSEGFLLFCFWCSFNMTGALLMVWTNATERMNHQGKKGCATYIVYVDHHSSRLWRSIFAISLQSLALLLVKRCITISNHPIDLHLHCTPWNCEKICGITIISSNFMGHVFRIQNQFKMLKIMRHTSCWNALCVYTAKMDVKLCIIMERKLFNERIDLLPRHLILT